MSKACVIDLETDFSMVDKLVKGVNKKVTDYGSPFNDDNRVVLVGVMDYQTKKYVSFDMSKPNRLEKLKYYLTSFDTIIGHNVKYEYMWLRKLGIDMGKFRLLDTMVLEYINLKGLHNEFGLGLDVVGPRYGGTAKFDLIKKYWKAGITTSAIPSGVLSNYLFHDVDNTYRAFHGLVNKPAIIEQKDFCTFYSEVLRCVCEMEYAGASFNGPELGSVTNDIESSLLQASANLSSIVADLTKNRDMDLPPLNLDSPAQMMPLFYSKKLKDSKDAKAEWKRFVSTFKPNRKGANATLAGKIEECFEPVPYGAGIKVDTAWLDSSKHLGANGISTSSNIIKLLQNWSGLGKKQEKLITAMTEYSKASTWKSSNLAGILNGVRPDGFIHGNFNMAVTTTRRFSSSEPNMQNWPREGTNPLKKLVKSRYRDGYILNTDYAQLEFRAVGLLSGDEQLVRDVAAGFDIHAHSATMAFGERFTNADPATKKALRTEAKATTFRFQYGAMPKNKTEQAIYDAFYGKYTKVAQWQEKIEFTIARDKRYVCPFTGSVFDFPEARHDNKWAWLTKAKNYPVQYLASVITNCGMVGVNEAFRELDPRALLILTVHDSLVADVPKELLHKAAAIMKDKMENINEVFYRYFKKTLDIQLNVDVQCGPNWYQQEEYKNEGN